MVLHGWNLSLNSDHASGLPPWRTEGCVQVWLENSLLYKGKTQHLSITSLLPLASPHWHMPRRESSTQAGKRFLSPGFQNVQFHLSLGLKPIPSVSGLVSRLTAHSPRICYMKMPPDFLASAEAPEIVEWKFNKKM